MELGTVAAAAQFVDLGCRSLFGAYRFLKDLKDVPANLLFTLDDLGHFSGLMDDLRSAIEKADPRLRGITPTQSQRVTRILDSTADICKQLKELLAPCCPPAGSSSSRSRKLWRALISVKREIDIVNRCERLERLKHDLNRELQSCDLAMLTSVKSDLAAVSVNLQQTTSSLSAMEARLNSVAFPQTFRLGNNGIQDPKVAPLDQRDDPLPDTPIRSTTASLRPSQRPTVSVNQMIMELHRCLVLGEPPASTFDSSLRNTSRDEKAYVLATSARQLVEYPQDLKMALEHRLGNIDAGWQSPVSCQCPKIGHQLKQRSRLLGPLRYHTSSKRRHLPDCPFYLKSDCETTKYLSFPHLPFLAGTIEVLATFHSKQRLTCFSVSYSPKVRRIDSSSFALFRDVLPKRMLEPYHFEPEQGEGRIATYHCSGSLPSFDGLHARLQCLSARLGALFRSYEAAPNEKDEYGNTLLFELLYVCQVVSGTPALSATFLNLVNDIAAFLVNSGVDLNAALPITPRFSPRSSLKVINTTCTAANLAFDALVMQARPCGTLSPEFSLYRELISRLGLHLEAPKLGFGALCPAERLSYKSACLDLMLSPHRLDLSTDLTPLHFAVLSRSTSKLQHHLKRDQHKRSPWFNSILTPLECALGWPEGLRLLIDAGCPASAALQLAVFRDDVQSAGQILSVHADFVFSVSSLHPRDYYRAGADLLRATLCAHCQLAPFQIDCAPPHRRACCLLSYRPLEANSGARHDIMALVVAAFRSERAHLADLALKHLPPTHLRQLGVCSDTLLDANAFTTYTALQDHGVPVPSVLRPSRLPVFLSFNISCQLGGFQLAKLLFENGFRELNPQVDGVTPLALLFHGPLAGGQKESMIQWFLEHGANPVFSLPRMLPNFLFYLGSVYNSDTIYRKTPAFSSAVEMVYEQNHIGTVPIFTAEVKKLSAAARDRKTTPSMIRLVARSCDPMQRDSCRCYCSSGGCLPLHKFRNGIEVEVHWPIRWPIRRRPPRGFIAKRWATISDTVQSWIRDCDLNESQARECLRDACRLEIFTRLGMAHTCCFFWGGHEPRGSGYFPTRQHRDPETCRELEEEDAELRQQLEAIMEAYDKASEIHCGPINEFWAWWWSIVQQLLPEIPAEQRRRMYGDYEPEAVAFFGSRKTCPPVQRWDFWNIYEDENESGESAACGSEDMTFIDEIKQYFADVLSRDAFGGKRAEAHSPDAERLAELG